MKKVLNKFHLFIKASFVAALFSDTIFMVMYFRAMYQSVGRRSM